MKIKPDDYEYEQFNFINFLKSNKILIFNLIAVMLISIIAIFIIIDEFYIPGGILIASILTYLYIVFKK